MSNTLRAETKKNKSKVNVKNKLKYLVYTSEFMTIIGATKQNAWNIQEKNKIYRHYDKNSSRNKAVQA